MNGFNHGSEFGWRRRCVKSAAVLFVFGGFFPMSTRAQISYQTDAGEMVLVESDGAALVVENVRSRSKGIMVEVFVNKGDFVRKGQILGHAELEATKLQLDLARQTMETKANVEAAKCQAEAWAATREQIEEAVHKRKEDETRLAWATAMERMYQSQYEVQLAAEKTQRIQYEYWKQQYENRFFRAPLDGTVSEVLVQVGKPVSEAVHAFTIRNENTYLLPVPVPAQLASTAVPNETLPVRSSDGKSVSHGRIDSVMDDPGVAGRKIVRLLLKAADFPAATRANLIGMKFDVLLPRIGQENRR